MLETRVGLLEVLLNILVRNDFLLEEISTRLRGFYHLDALAVCTTGVVGFEGSDRFLCHSSKPFN